ncbi:haloacid dehalogenase type II [Actinopolymorpha pittospori]|uniref:2-haloacid dehalogenase n=1 Tax=Actinopolymorpha pittospori TaxID=648752 RepID=A0A927N147_9ACTN|nr:haloacid dehalogenase type II [Actinopolymorpha pittospori]MBE1608993.1 2-haloacid dehalogenase [Actinopolymorpha pittospori]
MAATPLIVFDVNETLLDLETLTPAFERIFHERSAMRMWFANLILYSEALTLAQVYVPFTEIGEAVLQMLADAHGIRISAQDKSDLTDRFATMPPHPEVPQALTKLNAAGFRLFTLTDNLLEIQGRQLEQGGIIDRFERRFSVDAPEVRHHKPSRGAYEYVETQLRVPPEDLFLVASHTWDTLGAVAAGWGAALIKRPGNDLLHVGPQPTLTGDDLGDVADQIIQRFG